MNRWMLSVPLAALSCAAALGEGPNALNVSWGDQIIVGEGIGKLDTPEKIARCIDIWQEAGEVGKLYWRVSAYVLRDYMQPRRESFPRYFEETERIFGEMDPLAETIKAAQGRDVEVFGYLTLFDEGSPPSVLYGGSTPFAWQSRFTIEHPEYLVCDRAGDKRQYGVMEYACPEVRKYKLDQILWFVDKYDLDGMYICTRTHSQPAEHADQFGFSEPVAQAYRERYGVDIRQAEFDLEKWRRLRGEFLTGFLRELRGEMSKRGKQIALAVPRGDYIGPPYGNLHLDWRTWAREKLMDDLVPGVISGSWHYPKERTDRELGYLCSQEAGFGMEALGDDPLRAYSEACRESGVRLYPAGGSYNATRRRQVREGFISGVMLHASSLLAAAATPSVDHHPALSLAGGSLTVDLWVRLDTWKDYPRLVSKYDHTVPDDAGRGWEIYVDEGRVVFRLNDGEREHVVTTEQAVPLERWCRLVCASGGEGGQMQVWIDGQLDAKTRPAPARLRATEAPLALGRYAGGGRPMKGALAEVKLFDRPVAPDEAAEPIAWWRMGELREGPLKSRGSVDGVQTRLPHWEQAELVEGPVTGTWGLAMGRR